MAKLGDQAVGKVVKLNVNGTPTDFIVVHQGLPSSSYGSSCDGTWLLMKNIYLRHILRDPSAEDSNEYTELYAHSYLTGTFFNLLSADIQEHVKTATIPYVSGNGTSGKLSKLSTKCFLLSYTEVGFSGDSDTIIEGNVLSYFTSNARRIAYYNGTATRWWTRSPYTGDYPIYVWNVNTSGSKEHYNGIYDWGIRPALILSPDLYVKSDGSVVTSVINGYANIGGTNKELSGGYVNVGGTWKEISDAYMNVNGVWKPMA